MSDLPPAAIPEPLRHQADCLAEVSGVGPERFLAMSRAERIAALEAADYLGWCAAQADDEAFARIMAAVPPGEPEEEWDRLPSEWTAHREEILAELARLRTVPPE